MIDIERRIELRVLCSTQAGSSSGGVNKGAIAGGVIGAILVVTALIVGFVYLQRRRQRLHKPQWQLRGGWRTKPSIPLESMPA
jgi:hypothetical protein